MSEAESEIRHRSRTKDKAPDKGISGSAGASDLQSASSSSPRTTLCHSRRSGDEGDSNSNNGILSPLWIGIIVLGLANGFLLFSLYQERDNVIHYLKNIEELELKFLEKERKLDNSIAQQNQAKSLDEVNNKLNQVTGKFQKENEELLAKNQELELALKRIKNFYLKTDGESELHLACYWRDEEAVKLLVQDGADLNGLNRKRESPLFRASTGAEKTVGLRIVKYLIDQGATVSLREYRGYTFLHELIESERTLTPSQLHDISEYLISKGLAKLFEFPDNIYGAVPLHNAVREVEVEPRTLSLLHKNGVDFNVVNGQDYDVYFYAIIGGRGREFLVHLLKLGVELERPNANNHSLIHFASEFGNVDVLEFLLEESELDINAADIAGNTALHHLMYNGQDRLNMGVMLEIAQLLIENGADLKLTNKAGKTPLEVVLKGENPEEKAELVELLTKHA